VRAIAAKTADPDDPDFILGECRKEIAVQVRKTITGGDVLQIEDFQIDMNAVQGDYHHKQKVARAKLGKNPIKLLASGLTKVNKNLNEEGFKKA
jgi:hypothetical protein